MPYNFQKRMRMHVTEKALGCAPCKMDFRMKADLEDRVSRKYPGWPRIASAQAVKTNFRKR